MLTSLTASACSSCGRRTLGDYLVCPHCRSRDVAPAPLATMGTVETLTHVGTTTVVEVRLVDGMLMLGRLDAPPESAARGMQVVLSNDEEAVFVPA